MLEYTQYSAGTEFLDKIGLDINILWDIALRPLLFGSIGAAFDLQLIPKETIFKSCVIVIIGLCIRVPTAFLAAMGRDLTIKERLFVALAWMPKATVQAALCSIPLSMIKSTLSESSDLTQIGNQIMSTGKSSLFDGVAVSFPH